MKKIFNIILLLICNLNCGTESEKNKNVVLSGVDLDSHIIRPMSQQKINELIDSAILIGNEKAYNKIASYYLINDMGEKFFFYAFLMANRHNCSEAFYNVYEIIASSFSEKPQKAIDKMDEKTKKFALFYLLKSYEMGYKRAKYQIDEIFGEGKEIPKSSYYQ
jgi:hypothetical protein